MNRYLRLAAILGIVLSSPTIAQNPKSTADTVGRGASGVADGARELKRLTACAYKRNRGYVDALLEVRPTSREERRILSQLAKVIENCMRSIAPAIYMDNAQTRGSFAEARYLSRYEVTPEFLSGEHEMAKIPASWTETDLSEIDTIEILKHDFADCVVSRDAINADEMLRSEPMSEAERAALQELIPSLGPCLQNGLTFTLDGNVLRSLLAQALDRSVPMWVATSAGQAGAN